MYERFTDRARKVMQLANQEAQRFNHEYIGTEHILLGLIKEGSGVAANVLKNLEVDLRKIRLEVEKLVQSGPEMVTMGKLPQTPRAKKVIEYSMEEARNLNHSYVGTEHILLGLLREQEGVAAQVLMNLGLKLEDVREEVLNLLGHGAEGSEGERAPSGGGSSGDLFMQIFADVFGIPAVRNEVNGAAGLGSAICAAVAAGAYTTFDTAIDHMVRIKAAFHPIGANVSLYGQMNRSVYGQITRSTDGVLEKAYPVFNPQ